jgi:DNA polymerase
VRLVLDVETSSTIDLRRTGAQVYAQHPDTRITVLAFAIDDGDVQTWVGGPCPQGFRAAILQGAVVVAHNYLFEWNLYTAKLQARVLDGWPPIHLSKWSCTMARALVAGYPASLEQVSVAAKLNIPKDKGARDLMLRMARPRTTEPTVTWWHETSVEHFTRLVAYCVNDVQAERELDHAVPELSPRERKIFECDHRINQRGLNVDTTLVGKLHTLAGQAKRGLAADLVRITNGQVSTPNQVTKLREWLVGMGVDLPDLRRATVARILLTGALPDGPRRALQARLDASRSSVAKLDAILSARSQDGAVRGCFQYYGAGRTGRWAGRRLQPQNLFRGSISPAQVNDALVAILKHDATVADLGLLFGDSPMGVVASLMRSTIMARPGHKLVVVDLSQIEARVLAWLAGQTDVLAVFTAGEDIYVATARKVHSNSRQLGKVLVLACGFGMGPLRFQETAAGFGLVLGLSECVDLVAAWRETNKRIVDFWWATHRVLMRITRHGGMERVGRIVFARHPRMLTVRLPSGRHLVYRHPRIDPNPDNGHEEFTYMGPAGGGSGWTRLRSWPGKLVENIVQATARDVMADAMIELDAQGIPLTATVHDELIADVPDADADATYAEMQRVMASTPFWAQGLPMGAAGFVAQRYQKG